MPRYQESWSAHNGGLKRAHDEAARAVYCIPSIRLAERAGEAYFYWLLSAGNTQNARNADYSVLLVVVVVAVVIAAVCHYCLAPFRTETASHRRHAGTPRDYLRHVRA